MSEDRIIKIHYKGTTYVGTLNSGILKVRIKRTINEIIVGVYSLTTKRWSYDDLPDAVKTRFEKHLLKI